MEKNNVPEEVTITPVIKDVERLVNHLFSLLISIIKGVGKAIQNFVINSFKLRKTLGIIALVGAIIGFTSIYIIPRQYFSSLVVDFHIDTKLQMFADVNYFNTLISKQKQNKLAKILNISEEEAKTISSFKLEAYYSYVENVKKLNIFHNELDTSIRKFVDFQTLFEEEENPELGNRYVISIYSSEMDLFGKIEVPLVKFLERSPELQKMRLNNISTLQREKRVHEQELIKLDTLTKVLNTVMVEQSKANFNSANKGTYISLGSEGNDDKKSFNQLEVQNRYVNHSQEIINIENKLVYFDTCYNIISHINPTGTEIGFGKLGRACIVSLIAFFLGFFSLSFRNLYLKVKHAAE